MGPHKNRRRMRPAPQGRAYREQRHYCHITVLVSSEKPEEKVKFKPKKQVKVAPTVEEKVVATPKKAAAKKDGEDKAKAPAKKKAVKSEETAEATE